jgi:hypothetical protein
VVNFIAKRWLMLVFLLLLTTNLQAKVSIFPKKVMLGLPVIMIISGKNIEEDFKKIDKAELKKRFEIYDIDGDADRLRFVLYPKKTGNLNIPAMHSGNIKFKGEAIVVAENTQVTIKWQPPKNKIYKNQQINWQAEVRVNNSANQIIFEQHPHYNSKLSYKLFSEPFKKDSGFLGKTEQFAMNITPNKVGKVVVRTPVVKIKNTSSNPWLFFDQTVEINVLALPSYLPVATPVGKVNVQMASLPWFISTGELTNLHWSVSAENISLELLPDLSQQLIAKPEIEWLSPSIKPSQAMSEGTNNNKLNVIQPFRVNTAGVFIIPSVRITFFEPKSEQLKDFFTDQQLFLVIPKLLVWLLNIIIYGLILIAVLIFAIIFWQAILKYILIKELQQAKTSSEVWSACLQWSDGLLIDNKNLSIGQWYKLIIASFGNSFELDKLIEQLNKQNYGQINIKTKAAAIKWSKTLPYFKIKLFFIQLIKWQNYLLIFFKGNK